MLPYEMYAPSPQEVLFREETNSLGELSVDTTPLCPAVSRVLGAPIYGHL